MIKDDILSEIIVILPTVNDEGNPNVPDDNELLSGHLECIIGYDPLTDTVIINNCHYMESRIGLGEIRLSDLCADMERLWYFEDTNN